MNGTPAQHFISDFQPSTSRVARTSLASGEDFRISANVELETFPEELKKKCVLFYTPDTEELARKIAATAGGSITLGGIRWK